MAPSPRRRAVAAPAEDEQRLNRIASRIMQSPSDADGSTEAVLSLAQPSSLSRTRSTISSSTSSLSASLPVVRTKSTPQSSAIGGKTSRGGNSPMRLAYAMRKVFSREEKSGWEQQEAEGFLASTTSDDAQDELQSSPDRSPNRFASAARVVTPPRVDVQENEDEEGAMELVLDYSDSDDADIITNDGQMEPVTNNNSAVAGTVFNETARKKRFNKRSGYRLRKVLSNPNGQKKMARPLRRTPSYEPKGYNHTGYFDYGDDDDDGDAADYNDDEGHISQRHELSTPIELSRTLSFRRNRSNVKAKSNKYDDDLSTVAESINSSLSGSSGGFFGGYNASKGKRSRKFLLTRIVIPALILLALVFTALGIYMFVGKNDSSQLENNEYTGGADSDDAVDAMSKDEAGNEDEEVSIIPEASLDEDASGGEELIDEVSRASEDGTASSPNEAAETSSSATAVEDESPPDEEPYVVFEEGFKPGLSTVTTSSPTPNPTMGTYTKFYVMADCPYDDNERYNIMPRYIEGLSDDADFLAHLGDLQYAQVDDCQEYAYDEASSILRKSRIPAFVLPGDNDINDCDDHEHGEYMWEQYFYKIDEEWDHSFNLTRWGKLNESFSFLHKGVLYFGLNIVGGSPYSKSEKRDRHEEHLEYIRWIIDNLDEDEFQVMVLLAHAEPGSNHEDFFEGRDGFAAIVEEVGKPTVHFHGDWHEYYEVEGDFGVDNYMRISLDGESVSPPIKVEIDVSKKNPIKVNRRRRDLDVDCCDDGWPRHDEL